MKRLLYILCLICLPLSMHGQDIVVGSCGKQGDNAIWELNQDTLFVHGNGEMQDYNNNHPVPWKVYSTQITHVVIGNRITSIGNTAFSGLENLISVILPESVSAIGDGAFRNCRKLKAIELPANLISIGESAFSSCYELDSIVIPNSVKTEVLQSTFAYCRSLKSVVLPENVKTLTSTFRECVSLTSITIPEGVTSIAGAFFGCEQLAVVIIPHSITSITSSAFYGCMYLEDVFCYATEVPSTDLFAFANNSMLLPLDATLHVPALSIESYKQSQPWSPFKRVIALADGSVFGETEQKAIYYNFNYEDKTASVTSGPEKYSADVTIPDRIEYWDNVYRVTAINSWSFLGCRNLTSVTITDNVKSIGPLAFADCNKLAAVKLPKNLTTINDYTFSGCSNLSQITLPDGVTSIGEGAFADCRSLEYLSLPTKLVSVGNRAFASCTALTAVEIQKGITLIDENAYEDCTRMTKLTIGGNYCEIRSNAFCGCTGLTEIYLYADSMPLVDESAFENSNYEATVYVPTSSLQYYQSTAPWCYFRNVIAHSDTTYESVATIGYMYFPSTKTATAIDVRDSKYSVHLVIPSETVLNGETYQVTAIGEKCCYLNKCYEKIDLPNTIRTIGEQAFYGSALRSIVIPNSVVSIGGNAFGNCRELQSVVIGRGVTDIHSDAFRSHNLCDITCLAEHLPQTNEYAFEDYTYDHAILHVPAQSLDEYKSTAPWSNFQNIVAIAEGETDGINEIVNGKWANSKSIFNLYGQRINGLQKGLNIVDGKKVVVK